jgi:hypothetical protein
MEDQSALANSLSEAITTDQTALSGGVSEPQQPGQAEPTPQPEQHQEAAPSQATEEKTPYYDSRRRDPLTGRYVGSVYNSEEELRRGAEEKDNTIYRQFTAYEQLKNNYEQAQQRLREIEAQRLSASTTQPQQAAQQQAQVIPAELVEQFGEDGARAVMGLLQSTITPLTQKIAELERKPEEVVQRAFAERQKNEEVSQRRTELSDLASKYKDVYLPLDEAAMIMDNPAHPQYERAELLNRVAQLADQLGSVEKAHQFIMFERGQFDMDSAIKRAREEERAKVTAELTKSLGERGARMVSAGSLVNGNRGIPSGRDLSEMNPMDKIAYQKTLLSNIDFGADGE